MIGQDRRLVGRIVEGLCSRIDELDGTQIAVETTRMDEINLERRNGRANELVRSLSSSAAEVLLTEAEKAAKYARGGNTDAVALA